MIFRKSLFRKNVVNHFQLERRGLGKRRARFVWVPPNQGNYEINIFWYSFYWILNYYYLFKDCKASSVWVGAPQSGHLCGLFQLHQIDPFRLAQKFTGHVKIIHAWIYDFGFESAFPPSFVIADITVLELQNWQVWQCPLGQKLVETEGWAHWSWILIWYGRGQLLNI